MERKSIGEWLSDARLRLFHSLSDRTDQEASLDAQVLLSSVLDKPRAWILAHTDANIDVRQRARLNLMLDQLATGVPLPYLLGHWEFYGLQFDVSPAVLIPRPETELLVEQAIIWLRHRPDKRKAADVGTGSGCIAVTIAHQIIDLSVVAVDRSWPALQIAQRNVNRHLVNQRVKLVQSDLLTATIGPFDLVCANLPYIPHTVLADLPVARYEPSQALDGGSDGLSLIRELFADMQRLLAPGGLLLIEIQFDQGEAVQRMANHYMNQAKTTIHADLAGLPRLAAIQDTRTG